MNETNIKDIFSHINMNGVNLDACSFNTKFIDSHDSKSLNSSLNNSNNEVDKTCYNDHEEVYFNEIIEEDEESDEYLKMNNCIRKDSCCIRNLIGSDSGYSSLTVTSTASSSPNSTSYSLFKLSSDSLTSSFGLKPPSGKLNIAYSGKAKVNNFDPVNNTELIKNKTHIYNNLIYDKESILNINFNYGDDCSFIFSSNKSNYFFGIADGVSANRLRGYDARLFPFALLSECTHCIMKNAFENNLNSEIEQSIEKLSQDSFLLENNDCEFLYKTLCKSHINVQEKCVYGSSTVCLLSLKFQQSSNALLSTCNLGDSGYMIIRNKCVLFKSQSQSHRYNAPYQLGCTPPELLEHDLYRDRPADSILQTHDIQSGDFLLISTDGLFDNLYEDEIALIITEHVNSKLIENHQKLFISSNHNTGLVDNCIQIEKSNKKFDDEIINNQDKSFESNFDKLSLGENTAKEKKCLISNAIVDEKLIKFEINNEILESACDLLIEKAFKAGIKKDDMLITLIYVD